MNQLLKRFCLTLLASMSLCVAVSANKTVYLKDFLTVDAAKIDATPAVRAAMEYCAEIGANRLVLPGGVLCMRADQAVEKYQFISNNDENLKRIAFDMVGMRDFEIQGCGTELLFTGFISPFNMTDCQNITISDLKIDFTRTFNSEGVVVDKGEGWLEIDFPDHYRYDIINGCLRFIDNEGIIYPFSNLLEFDAVKREPAFMVNDFWLSNRTIPAQICENGNVRIFRKDLTATVGNVMVFGAAARYNPGFTLYDCRKVTLRNIDLYHCGGMGVIAQCSRDIEVEKMVVTPSPGKGRMISITADATHFVNCGGYIRLLNCVFENQKDDATNIHGLYMSVDRVVAPNKVMLRWHNAGQFGVDFISPGMRLEFVNNKNVETYAHRTVKSVKRLNKIYTEVMLTEELPQGVEKGHAVAADDCYPEVLIKGCRMRGNRARGLLLGSRAKMVIEDNYFHIAGAAILFEGDGNYWYEQSGVRDVIIRNNIFENGNYGCRGWGSACIAVGSGIPERESSRYHHNILVEGNTFRVFDPRIVNLYCVDGFKFKANNRIEITADYPYIGTEKRNFVEANCDNVVIEKR